MERGESEEKAGRVGGAGLAGPLRGAERPWAGDLRTGRPVALSYHAPWPGQDTCTFLSDKGFSF